MRLHQTTLGGLTCRVVVGEGKPRGVVVLCHGYGAPGTDLVGLGPEMRSVEPRLADVDIYFPEAPLAPPMLGGGRAWWPIDMRALEKAMRTGSLREMKDTVPEGMDVARRSLRALLDDVQRDTGLPMSKIVLGGFSQGAMLTTDVTLRVEDAPAGLIVFSGALLMQDEWRQKAKNRAGLQVLQTHGRQDPILGFAQAEDLRDLFVEAGLEVDFRPFDGPHTISGDGLSAAAKFVAARLE